VTPAGLHRALTLALGFALLFLALTLS